jgi:hypothetical protein
MTVQKVNIDPTAFAPCALLVKLRRVQIAASRLELRTEPSRQTRAIPPTAECQQPRWTALERRSTHDEGSGPVVQRIGHDRGI